MEGAAPLIEMSAAFQTISDMALVTDSAPGKPGGPFIMSVNPATTVLTGYEASELIGSPLSMLFGERTDRLVVQRLWVTPLNATIDAGLLLYRKDHSAIWTDWRVQPAGERGDATRIAVGRHIDRRRGLEADLRSLLTAIDNAVDPMFLYAIFDGDELPRVQYANRAAELQTGYTRDELETANRTGPATDRKAIAAIIASMQRGETLRSRQRLYRKDGSLYWAEVNLRPIPDRTPGRKRWIMIERDVTEAVAREDLLEGERDAYSTLAEAAQVFLDSHDADHIETAYTLAHRHLVAGSRPEALAILETMYESAVRRLRLFEETVDRRNSTAQILSAQADVMAMLAHDIRGPLNSVIGFAELIAEECADQPAVSDYTQTIINAANRVADVTSEVIVAAQLDRNEYNAAIERFDLTSILRSVIGLLPGGKRVMFEIADETIEMHGDIGGLRHIVSNLAANALKYSADPSPVTIAVRRTGDTVCISFSDEGMGIPVSEVAHVFERFARASNAKRSNIRGTGLGLYFVKQLVDRSQGSIVIESAEGVGTVATVTLPLRPLAESSRPSIVTIEESSDESSLIASELRERGYAVRVFRGPEAADGVVRRESVSIAIVDVDAVEEYALETFRQTCSERNTAVVLLGGDGNTDGTYGLRKPLVTADLMNVVERVVPLSAPLLTR